MINILCSQKTDLFQWKILPRLLKLHQILSAHLLMTNRNTVLRKTWKTPLIPEAKGQLWSFLIWFYSNRAPLTSVEKKLPDVFLKKKKINNSFSKNTTTSNYLTLCWAVFSVERIFFSFLLRGFNQNYNWPDPWVREEAAYTVFMSSCVQPWQQYDCRTKSILLQDYLYARLITHLALAKLCATAA